MNIKNKITGTVFLLVAAFVVLLTLAGYRYLAHTFKESVSQQHATILNMAARHIDDEIQRSLEMLRLVARGIDPVMLRDSGAVARELGQAKSARAAFDGGLLILDGRGRIVGASPASAGACLDWQDAVTRGKLNGTPQLSPPFRSISPPHRPVIAFSVPILAAGRPAGWVVGLNDLMRNDSLADFGQAVLGKAGRLFLVERNRSIIMHPDRSRIMETVPPGKDPGFDQALAGNRLVERLVSAPGSEPRISAAVPLKNANWFIATESSESEAYAPLAEARTFFLLTMAAALLAILGLTRLATGILVQRLAAPLIRLVGQLHDLPGKEGEERRLQPTEGEELGSLALAVNDLVGELDQKRAIVEENRELYRIIADFTSELALLRNPDGSIRYISANCLALTGYADREFLESPQLLEEIVHPEDRDLWRQQGDPAGAGEEQPVELRLVGRGGETRWFKYQSCRATGADGGYLGVRGSFRDISQDRMLEQTLEGQRRFVESLLENTSTPLFVIDKNHRILVWNRAIVELTGLASADMVGTNRHWQPFYAEKRPTLCDLVMDGETDRIGSHYRRFTRDVVMQGIFRGEGWYPNLNGRDRYLFFDAAPVMRDGEMAAVVETLYDITERVRAEESLHLFSQAVEQSANTIVITDQSGTIQYVNRKFSELTGYSSDEAVGQNPRLLKSGQEPPELYRELWETITSGREWQGELHNRRKDGSLFWESALISPIYDQNGKLTHFLGIKEDISAKKDADRQLQKKQAELVLKHEQLANLFRQVEKGKREWESSMDCIDDLVAMVDSEGLVRRCNRAFVEFTGCPLERMQFRDWRELLRAAGLDIDSLEGMRGELFHEPSRRWLTLNTYPYGEGSGEVIMLHDLTQIKQVSEQLAEAYQELKSTHSQLLQQEKMASIGQLAAGVAHEINNPMGFISSNLGTMGKYLERLQGFLELQSAGVDETAPDSLKEELAQARRRFKVDYILDDARSLLAESKDGAERVRNIVQNLKSFSRVDEAQECCVDLNECLESTITIAWNELKYKTTLNRDYGELPLVKCLPQQLNQVFLNILVNAAHAIETQGEVTVTTRQEGEQVSIAIHDTGCGIPAEIVSRIFEPFFTTKEVGKGTGLGLSISYDIIKKHNGTIEVASSAESGTTFTIRLPIEGVRG